MSIDIQISTTSLDIIACINTVSSKQSGGIDVFIGTVRETTKGKTVVRLEFETYESMALLEMRKIMLRHPPLLILTEKVVLLTFASALIIHKSPIEKEIANS